MKKFIWAMPLTVLPLIATPGCAPAAEDNPDKMLTTAASNQTSDEKAADAKPSDDKPSDASTQQASESPSGGKTYVVAEEGHPSMPSEALKYLKNASVPPPPDSFKVADKQKIKFATTKGDIVLELATKEAPLHAKSIAYLVSKKFYDGITFHRYVEGFVIQAGDPMTKNPKLEEFYGAGGPGYTIPREYNDLKHDQFVLSMARSGEPDSGGSQFFITLAKTDYLDQEHSQDGVGYTVFGKVIKGSDVVMKIRAGDRIKTATLLK